MNRPGTIQRRQAWLTVATWLATVELGVLVAGVFLTRGQVLAALILAAAGLVAYVRRRAAAGLVTAAGGGLVALGALFAAEPGALLSLHPLGLVWTAAALIAALLLAGLLGLGIAPTKALTLVGAAGGSLSLAGTWILLRESGHPGSQPLVHFEIGGAVPDADCGYLARPGSRARTYYPDNPRGYFHRGPAVASPWRSWTLVADPARCGQGRVEYQTDPEPAVRIAVTQADSESAANGRWQSPPIEAPGGQTITVAVHLRADEPRSAVCGAWCQGTPCVPLQTVELGPQWTEWSVSFRTPTGGQRATLAIDIGASTVAVDCRQLRLTTPQGAAPLPTWPVTPYWVESLYNEHGLRERPGPRHPADKRTTILLLGDSLAFGAGVHAEDTVGWKLEERLNAGAKTNPAATGGYRVINAAQPGYSPREERATYLRLAPLYQPRLVLLGLYTNDHQSIPAKVPPGTELRDTPPRGPDDYQACFDQLVQLHHDCGQRDAKLVVFLFRSESLSLPWRWLAKGAAKRLTPEGIPWFDPGEEVIRAAAGADLMVHPSDGHPNELAHHLVADQLARFLLRTPGLLPAPSPEATWANP